LQLAGGTDGDEDMGVFSSAAASTVPQGAILVIVIQFYPAAS
jgi:hypothetical protein